MEKFKMDMTIKELEELIMQIAMHEASSATITLEQDIEKLEEKIESLETELENIKS